MLEATATMSAAATLLALQQQQQEVMQEVNSKDFS
jgi:hypothetical protein